MGPPRGRAAGLALRVAATVVLLSVAAAGDWRDEAPPPPRPPQLVVDDSVGADFEALAQETWERFLTTFRAREGCFGDVYLRAAGALDSRAGYDPETATVTVRVPGSPAMLQSALVHEWAHHLEFQCWEHEELIPAFLAAQGLPPDTPWRPGDPHTVDWSSLPSEQFAEAVVELVLGRPVPTWVRVTPEAVGVVADWAARRPL